MIQMLPRTVPSHSRHQPPPCAREGTGPTGQTGSLPSASPTPGRAPTGLFVALPSMYPAHSQTSPPFLAWAACRLPYTRPGSQPPSLGEAPPLISGGDTEAGSHRWQRLWGRRLSFRRGLSPSVSGLPVQMAWDTQGSRRSGEGVSGRPHGYGIFGRGPGGSQPGAHR